MSSDETANGGGQAAAAEPPGDGWRVDKQGRSFIAARGRSGIVYRQGNETVEEALARDAKGPRDRPPRKSGPAPGGAAGKRKPPAPTAQDLKELEYALAEGLRSPAMIAAAAGDEWLANHFTQQGPILARHLVTAAQHNPWLRAKLEAAMMGEDIMVKVLTLMTVGGAVIGYVAPPLLYLVRPPVPEKAYDMFGIPERKTDEEAGEDARPQAPAPAAGPASPPAT